MAITLKKAPIDWAFDYFKLAADPWPTNTPTGSTCLVYETVTDTGTLYYTPDNGTNWIVLVQEITLDAADLAAIAAQCAAAIVAAGLATAAELAKVPKSDAAVSWNATALAAILAQATAGAAAALVANAYKRQAGVAQEIVKTIDVHQAGGTQDIVVATEQDCILDYVFWYVVTSLTADAGTFTYVTIQTDMTTPQIICTSAEGAKAKLAADAQPKNWTEGCILPVGHKLQITQDGTITTADPSNLVFVIGYHAAVSGGYLA